LRLTSAMEHIVKRISLAHGDLKNAGIISASGSIQVRIDQPMSGTYTPENYIDDLFVRYRLQGDKILFCPDYSGGVCLAPEETLCQSNATSLEYNAGTIFINGSAGAGVPDVKLRTLVSPRCTSNN
jgi:hypothetical protein